MAKRRQGLTAATACLMILGTAATLMAGEFILRTVGYDPLASARVDDHLPTMYEPDARSGWRNKEGRYVYVPGSDPKAIQITILDDGTRTTGRERAASREDLVLIGGSYTRGSDISDEETFAWKLQARYPSLDVLNYGTGAYGTYQSLLSLETHLQRADQPALVLYGFVVFHETRNIDDTHWRRLLAENSRTGIANVPYVTLGVNGELVRHPPASFDASIIDALFSPLRSIQMLWYELASRLRKSEKREATRALILALQQLCAAHGCRVGVVVLAGPRADREDYHAFMAAHEIPSADCAYPSTPDLEVAGGGHPNGRMHTRWSECIAESVDEWLTL